MLVVLLTLVACAAEERLHRLVLITVDTLRADSLAENSMPNLWRWANEATLYPQCYAASASTQPTHTTLFTGLPPWRHGVTSNGMVLGNGHVTLVESLADAGNETAAVIASVPVGEPFGFAQGFDRFSARFTAGRGGATWPRRGEQKDEDRSRFYARADGVITEALGQLEAMTADKQFLWVHLFDPHDPYGDSKVRWGMYPSQVLERAERGEAVDAEVHKAFELWGTSTSRGDRPS